MTRRNSSEQATAIVNVEFNTYTFNSSFTTSSLMIQRYREDQVPKLCQEACGSHRNQDDGKVWWEGPTQGGLDQGFDLPYLQSGGRHERHVANSQLRRPVQPSA